MKKVTLSVAALTIAISGFGQCVNSYKDSVEAVTNTHVREITNTTEDIISWIREDEWNGRMMTKELADMYVENLLNILSKIEDLKINKLLLLRNPWGDIE